MNLRRVVIGLGSNLGDRHAYIAAAVERIASDGALRILGRASMYESPPAGGPVQDDYLNTAVLVATPLQPREVLRRLLAVERELGRARPDPIRWGPRTIDLDVLWIEGEAIDEPDLSVPHRRLGERPFAIQPLLELVPDATDPATGTRYASLPAASAPIQRVG